jgi:hypothetical protein
MTIAQWVVLALQFRLHYGIDISKIANAEVRNTLGMN